MCNFLDPGYRNLTRDSKSYVDDQRQLAISSLRHYVKGCLLLAKSHATAMTRSKLVRGGALVRDGEERRHPLFTLYWGQS